MGKYTKARQYYKRIENLESIYLLMFRNHSCYQLPLHICHNRPMSRL